MAHSAHGTGAAGAPATPSLAELAADFPDYQIVELIGRGGMGAVYQAVQLQLKRTVAIKVLPKELAADPEFGERFLREAQTLATLNHPGIITVYDYGERNGVFFLVTEFVDGVNLRQLMELGELSPAEALRIAPQLCTALQFAHERGVVHRDIKPENILIDTQGTVKVADFGLAKVARPGDAVELTRNTAVLGTPHYMAPEQWHGARQVDHRADIYSLGVVLYEMLTGNLPLGNFDMPSERGGVPQGLDAVVRRALAQQPKNRYQHAHEVQTDVEHQAQQLHTQQAGSQPRKTQEPSPRAGAAPQPQAAPQPRANASMVKGPILAIASAVIAVITIGLLAIGRQIEYRQAYRYESDLERYRASTEQAIELAQAGKEVPVPMPMPIAPPAPMVPVEALPVIAASIMVGALLLVLAFGFASIRTIRNSNGSKTGLGLAVFTAWIAPLAGAGALACAPLSAIRSNDLQVMLGIVLIGGLIYGAVRFLMWETARQRALIHAGVPAHRGKAWTAVALTLGLCAIGNAIASPSYLRAERTDASKNTTPTFAADLIGCTYSEVIARLGPPIDIRIGTTDVTWAYRNEFDKLVPAAIRFTNGRVTSVDKLTQVLRVNADTSTQPNITTLVETLTPLYGEPIKMVRNGDDMHYHYGNGVVAVVRDGGIISYQKEAAQPKATAPINVKDLLGKTRPEVMQLLGPPLGITVSTDAESWSYRNDDDRTIEKAVVFSGENVIAVDNGSNAFLPNPADVSQPQLGQSMNEFVKQYGSPASQTTGSLFTEFIFDNGLRVAVRNGIVVGVDSN